MVSKNTGAIEEIELSEDYILFKGTIGEITYRVFHTSRQINAKREAVDVCISRDNKEYWGTLITLGKVQECLDRYKTTGENANGAYFDMKYPILVEEINPRIIRMTIEDFLKKETLEPFFQSKKEE